MSCLQSLHMKKTYDLKKLTNRQSCQTNFLELNINPVPYLYILSNLLHVKQNIDTFSYQSSYHDHLTRQRNNVTTPYVRLSKTSNSHIIHHQFKLYSKLPLAIINLPHNVFYKVLQDWIIIQDFYITKEYYF